MYITTTIPVIYQDKDFQEKENQLCLFIRKVDSINDSLLRVHFYYESRKIKEIEHINTGELVEMGTAKFEFADSIDLKVDAINSQEENSIPDNLSETGQEMFKIYLSVRLEMYKKLLKKNANLTLNQIELVV